MNAIASTTGLVRQQRTGMSIGRKRWRTFARNKLAIASLVFLIVVHLAALLAPFITPYQPQRTAPTNALQPPSPAHILGTDEVGRDVFTRLLYGGRVSLLVGIAAVAVSVVVGTLAGALSGFFRGWVDSVLMRFTDAMLVIPTFFLLLLVLTIFGGSLLTIILVIGLTSWMTIARLVRGEILRFNDAEFVVAATLGVAYAILTESALSYLGLGVQPPTATWGNMLQNAQQNMFNAPLLSVYPGILISLTVLAYSFFGDGLRDALDPKLVA
jgi:peptide/nickel transport system permease protein